MVSTQARMAHRRLRGLRRSCRFTLVPYSCNSSAPFTGNSSYIIPHVERSGSAMWKYKLASKENKSNAGISSNDSEQPCKWGIGRTAPSLLICPYLLGILPLTYKIWTTLIQLSPNYCGHPFGRLSVSGWPVWERSRYPLTEPCYCRLKCRGYSGWDSPSVLSRGSIYSTFLVFGAPLAPASGDHWIPIYPTRQFLVDFFTACVL